jgi:predicted acylesterase/phospholipase RssA
MEKLLDLSGGSTKGRAEYKVAKMVIDRGFDPTIISAVSIGAILAVPIAMKKTKELEKELSNFDLNTIFTKSPVTKNGNLTFSAIKNILLGRDYLAKMGTLRKKYEKIITEEDHYNFVTGDFIPVYTLSIDFTNGSRVPVKLNLIHDYKTFVDHVIASASIPIFSEPIEADGKVLYDGGIRDHSLGYSIMDKYDVKQCVSIFTRPQDNLLPKYTRNGLVSVIERMVDILMVEISKSDERLQKYIAEDKGIDLTQVFIPSVLETMYDTSPDRLRELDEKAIESANFYLKNFVPI